MLFSELSDSEISHLLTLDADERSIVLENGFTKYGTSPFPIEVFHFGSCTGSSTILSSLQMLREHFGSYSMETIRSIEFQQKYWEEIRNRLFAVLDISNEEANIVFTPSGTDAETMICEIMLHHSNKPLTNIVIAPLEVGSGTVLAAGGLRFSSITPDGNIGEIGSPINERVSKNVGVIRFSLRDVDGGLSNVETMPTRILNEIDSAHESNRYVILHMVAGTKTGVHAPETVFLNEIEESQMGDIIIVVDAAQGRFSRTGFREMISRGRIVILTGSKFFGGPPFSGAIFVPKNIEIQEVWKDDMSVLFEQHCIPEQNESPFGESPRLGFFLRWCIAIDMIERYYSIPKSSRTKILQWFEKDAQRIINESSITDIVAKQKMSDGEISRVGFDRPILTIVTFRIIGSNGEFLTIHDLRTIHLHLMSKDVKYHLGQPVLLVPREEIGALRIAIGGVLMRQLSKKLENGDADEEVRDYLSSLLLGVIQTIKDSIKELGF